MEASLKSCRDFSMPVPGQYRIQYYADKASGCNRFISMLQGQGPVGFQGFRTATLAFQVYFSRGFSWGKGGKMHGLLGGNTWGSLPCFGGVRQDFCHSARVMWSEGGKAQLYLYVPSAAHKIICDKYRNRIQAWCCRPTFPYGLEMDRGVLNFKAGVWQNVSLTVRLGVGNTSSVTLRVDDKATTVSGIPLQMGSDQSVRQTMFTTFYGGHSPDWFPEFDTHAIFRAWSYRNLQPLKSTDSPQVRGETNVGPEVMLAAEDVQDSYAPGVMLKPVHDSYIIDDWYDPDAYSSDPV
jgi:hypothetical protein